MLLGRQGVFGHVGEVTDFDGESFRWQKHEHIFIRGIVTHGQNEIVVALGYPPLSLHAFVVVSGFNFNDFVPVHDLEAEPGARANQRVRELPEP